MYIYWIIPKDMSEDNYQKLYTHSHIRYIKFSIAFDRFKMYYRMSRALEELIAFDGVLWDYDFILTNKTSLVPLYRLLQYRGRSFKYKWMRQIILLEDMPIMSFKSTISVVFEAVGDRVCLAGYQAADKVLISAYWEKAEILKQAKKFLSSAGILEVSNKLIEAAPSTVDTVLFKSKSMVRKIMKRVIPFTISYSGRMVAADQVGEVFKVLESHWVVRGGLGRGKVRTIMTSASRGAARVVPPECVDVVYADRDRFWDIVKNESAVGVFLSREEDYSMSMLEPLVLGLPMAIIKVRHTIASIGSDYPFFVSNMQEAYGVINLFYRDYAKYYKIFVQWARTKLLPLLKERNKTNVISEVLKSIVWFNDKMAQLNQEDLIWFENEVVLEVLKEVKIGEVFVFGDVIRALDKKQVFRHKLSVKFGERDKRANAFSIDWNMFRNILKIRYGCIDAGLKTGEMVRVK